MADAALVQFESLTSNPIDTKTLVRATHESFGIINLWAQATSENDTVKEIMQLLHVEAKGFFDTVSQSYTNAQAGYQFAEEAEEMCKSLLDPTCTDLQIQTLITEMRGIAQRAHEGATRTSNMFRANRKGFNSVTAKIPSARDNVAREHTQRQERKRKAERKADNWGNMVERLLPIGQRRKRRSIGHGISNGQSKAQGNPKIEDEGTSTRNPLHVAGALLSLPVTLPLVVVAKSRLSSLETQAEVIDSQIVSFGKAVDDLDSAGTNLMDLMEKMNLMANYWLKMDIVLRALHDRVSELRNSPTLTIKIKSLEGGWKRVGAEYVAYATQLAQLKDLSPEIKTITENHEKPQELSIKGR